MYLRVTTNKTVLAFARMIFRQAGKIAFVRSRYRVTFPKCILYDMLTCIGSLLCSAGENDVYLFPLHFGDVSVSTRPDSPT